jgi:hypothetical protein
VNDAHLITPNALAGQTIAMSMSDSADLLWLGLTPAHCNLAVAELARGVLLAGGNLMYGGRLLPEGFTQILMEEVARFGDSRHALTIVVPAPEHAALEAERLKTIDRQLGVTGRLVLLDGEGAETSPDKRGPSSTQATPQTALTAMRSYVTARTQARVLVGGKLTGYAGRQPGVIEEAVMALDANVPVYAAGGFGGAAAAVNRALGIDDQAWAPKDFPLGHGEPDVTLALEQVRNRASGRAADGLELEERLGLAATHRPGDIASLVVLGLARTLNPDPRAAGEQS